MVASERKIFIILKDLSCYHLTKCHALKKMRKLFHLPTSSLIHSIIYGEKKEK
jgi:hypothetical protein